MKAQIEYSDFEKLDLRVGTILEAGPFPDPKKTKLLVLKVDLGEDQPRTICAGIAQHYNPAGLIGKQIIVVANLAPRTFKGEVSVESHGMLLAAHGAAPIFLRPEHNVSNGAEVG